MNNKIRGYGEEIMDDLICRKVILCLLDCVPKSANEIADELGEALATVEDRLTGLVSGNICDEVSQDEVGQYVIRTDIETFAQLVQAFRSNEEEHDRETEQFVTSKYYHTRIGNQLVDYVLGRFCLDSVCQTDEDKEATRRLLLVSPSALAFALHGDTTLFSALWSNRNHLDASEATRDLLTGILRSRFYMSLLERLIPDMRVLAYASLYAQLQLRVAQVDIQVRLATAHGMYIDAAPSESFTLAKAAEDLPAGAPVVAVDPMSFAHDGLAFFHLGEFQTAIEDFDKALTAVKDPIQRATIWNNKGWAFLQFRQYQKAIECFDDGIALDSKGEIPMLRENKQIAEEYLARATDTDNLTEPTQIRFVQGYPIPFEETRFYEFKEIKVENAVRSITDTSDIYAVAFLNREGGRIFWGARDNDRITVGVMLDEQQKNDIRTKVSQKLAAVEPSIVGHWKLEFHNVCDFQGGIVADLWVVELVVPPPRERDVFYTGSGELFVKTDGGKQKLQGSAVTAFIHEHFPNNTETG